MKKIILLFVLFLSFFGFSSADCLNMEAGKLCLRMKNLGNGNYSIEKTLQPKQTKSIYMINCQILKPDNRLKDIGACDSNFTYTGTGNFPVRLYIYLEGEKNVMNFNREFMMLTTKQVKSISNLTSSWNLVIQKIIAKFPKLNNDTKWKQVSADFQTQLTNFLYGESLGLKSYSDMKNALIIFVKYTINQSK